MTYYVTNISIPSGANTLAQDGYVITWVHADQQWEAQPASTIPGLQGPTGPQGATGVAGSNGAQGAAGSNGSNGVQGSPGVTGATGPAGNNGAQGPAGNNGAQGSPGVTGSTGPTGAIGPQGNIGNQGPQGSPGITGATGVAGPQGSPGVTGATGPQGQTGPGYTGPTGPTGAQGATGVAGLNGASSFWLQNNGVTLGQFNSLNLSGGLQGVTGPGSNAITISDLTDFIVMGVTGTISTATMPMLQWANTITAPTGALGYTTVATASAYIVVNKSDYYEIDYSLAVTGTPSGMSSVQVRHILNATGAAFGGTVIPQSMLVLSNLPSGTRNAFLQGNNSYIYYIASGSNISTWVNTVGGATSAAYSPTGTFFQMKSV